MNDYAVLLTNRVDCIAGKRLPRSGVCYEAVPCHEHTHRPKACPLMNQAEAACNAATT